MIPTIQAVILPKVPSGLVALRLALGPVLLVSALIGHTGAWFLAGLTAAFHSDVFDGMIARRVGISTPELRVWTAARTWSSTFAC